MAIKVICAEPGCPRLSDKGEVRRGRCPSCYRAYARKQEKGRDRKPRQRGRKGQALREETLDRFGRRCAALVDGERCEISFPLEVHHVNGNPSDDRPVNRVPLCKRHHLEFQHNPDAIFALPDGGGPGFAYFHVQ